MQIEIIFFEFLKDLFNNFVFLLLFYYFGIILNVFAIFRDNFEYFQDFSGFFRMFWDNFISFGTFWDFSG